MMGHNQIRDEIRATVPLLMRQKSQGRGKLVPEVRSRVTGVLISALGEERCFIIARDDASAHRLLEHLVRLADIMPARRPQQAVPFLGSECKLGAELFSLGNHVRCVLQESYD